MTRLDLVFKIIAETFPHICPRRLPKCLFLSAFYACIFCHCVFAVTTGASIITALSYCGIGLIFKLYWTDRPSTKWQVNKKTGSQQWLCCCLKFHRTCIGWSMTPWSKSAQTCDLLKVRARFKSSSAFCCSLLVFHSRALWYQWNLH